MNLDFATASRAASLEPLKPNRGAPPIIGNLISVARRRRWVIIGSIVGCLALGLVATLFMTPKYQASAMLEIQRENTSMVSVGTDRDRSQAVDQEFYQTQYGLLKSQNLAERVALTLRLQDSQQFFAMFGQEKTWFENGRPKPNTTREQRIRAAGSVLLNNFEVDSPRLSRLAEISFTSPDAALSQKVVNTWANSFIQMSLERRFEATSYARRFLEQRLAQTRARIDEADRRVVDYASKAGIINLPAGQVATAQGGVTSERPIIADDLAALNRALSEAIADRVRAGSRLGASGGQAAEALDNTAIANLRDQRARLAAEYARLMVQFEPGYPPARALQSQIAQLDRSITREESRVTGSLQETYTASLQRERILRERVDQLKSELLNYRRRTIQYDIFQRDADTNRQLYEALLQRYKEIGVAGGVGANNISVVDEAQIPLQPSSPILPLNLALSLLAGLLLGVGAAWALEELDQGIKDPSDVEGALEVPLLGTIPKVAGEEPSTALADRKSVMNEAYVSLLTALSFTTDHGVPRVIGFTSTRPAEGKSTSAYAIARSLARSGARAILVDTDMRSPSVHHLVGVENSRGLSNYLSGDNDLAAFVRNTDHDGLHIMSAGPQPPSAPELLGSERLRKLLSELLATHDHVVLDMPPLMGLADAPLVGSVAEGVVFVVEANGTQKNMARHAISRLRSANSAVLGVALTKFDSKRAQYGYGYEYGYGYGYGDTAARERRRVLG